jgi:hypothetical protein
MSVYFLQQSQRSPLQVNHSETRDHTNPKRQTVEPVLSEARTDVTWRSRTSRCATRHTTYTRTFARVTTSSPEAERQSSHSTPDAQTRHAPSSLHPTDTKPLSGLHHTPPESSEINMNQNASIALKRAKKWIKKLLTTQGVWLAWSFLPYVSTFHIEQQVNQGIVPGGAPLPINTSSSITHPVL